MTTSQTDAVCGEAELLVVGDWEELPSPPPISGLELEGLWKRDAMGSRRHNEDEFDSSLLLMQLPSLETSAVEEGASLREETD